MERDSLIINKDVTVIGGGPAGVCAAVSAAREGANVALIQNRSVLGGNSSSEMRVWAVGATAMGNNRFAAETGIICELDLENLYRNPEGNPYLWDALLLDVAARERNNLELFLNTEICEADSSIDEIISVIGYQSGTEKKFTFKSNLFIDCTGDGSVGYWAGASYMKGREGRNVFGEDMAPLESEPYVLGSTLLFYIKDAQKPVKFVPPDFAYSQQHIKKLLAQKKKNINIKSNGCSFWWIEYGGTLDTIKDNEIIRKELQRLVYGIWNYIKNSGEFCADTLTLEWVGSIPAKRESRRFIGDFILTQNHILQHEQFEDAVCHGGWPIDVHPEEGIYSETNSCEQRSVGIYQIPLRCLYSKNIENLLFAGRNISASHLAFASARVMKSCALTGQAAGTAAAIAVRSGKRPSDFSSLEIKKVQQHLMKADVWLCGKENLDSDDLAKEASVTASGFRRFSSESVDGKIPLDEDLYILMPALHNLSSLQLAMDGSPDKAAEIEVYTANALQNYSELRKIGNFKAKYKNNMDWVNFPCVIYNNANNVIIKIPAQKGAHLGISNESCCGVIGSCGSIKGMKLFNPCFSIIPEPPYFSPQNVINGIPRPEKQPNIWISNQMDEKETWIELNFKKLTAINEIQILFNPDFNRDYNHLRPDFYKNGWDKMPTELVKSFSLKIRQCDGSLMEIAKVENQITRQFKLKKELKTDSIKAEFYETYGSSYAQVFEIRAYG